VSDESVCGAHWVSWLDLDGILQGLKPLFLCLRTRLNPGRPKAKVLGNRSWLSVLGLPNLGYRPALGLPAFACLDARAWIRQTNPGSVLLLRKLFDRVPAEKQCNDLQRHPLLRHASSSHWYAVFADMHYKAHDHWVVRQLDSGRGCSTFRWVDYRLEREVMSISCVVA
jgi:hypothetical protein